MFSKDSFFHQNIFLTFVGHCGYMETELVAVECFEGSYLLLLEGYIFAATFPLS